MLLRAILTAAIFALAGCGETIPPPSVATPKSATPLPPEVEFDPATATDKHQAGKKARR